MNKDLGKGGADLGLAKRLATNPSGVIDGLTIGPDNRPVGISLTQAMVKRGFDVIVALLAMPVVLIAACVVLILNPFWNAGPVFYSQRRMGRDCEPFTVFKFRTMVPAEYVERGPDDPVEHTRITRLGHFLRRSRVDELPQFFNVLLGDMSVIGPRPDFWDHAQHYADIVPGYRQRYLVRPGITGLAQVDGGYAEGIAATLQKTRFDLDYIARFSAKLECYVLWRTLCVVLTGWGAR